MRTAHLALVVSALWLAGCSPANGMEVRVFGSGAGESGEGGSEPGPDGYGGGSSASGQGGEFAQGGEGGSSGEPGTPDASGGSANGGTGGDPGTGGSPGTGGDPGQGGSSSGGSNTGGSAPGGSGGDAGAAGSGGSVCNYPTSGFGTSPGNVISPSVSWTGFAPGSSSSSSISVNSFFDCDGKAGVNALLIVYGAGWCTACQDEASLIPDLMQTWGPAGIVVVELLVEDSGGSPATTQTAQQWRSTFNLTSSSYVAADPSFQLQSSAADSFPYKVLVDPRTMAIVSTDSGGTSDDAVMQLAQMNK